MDDREGTLPREGSPGDPPSAAGEPEHDLALIRSVAKSDRAAFAALYERHAARLGRYVGKLVRRPEVVGEVINDVMLVVWQSAKKFDPSRSRLSTWLFGIAHHKALKALERTGGRGVELSLDGADDEPGPEREAAAHAPGTPQPDPEQAAMARQLGASLARAMERLSAEHRAVLELAFGEDCSYQEIAQIVDCPVNTVKTRVFHARKRLAQLLEEAA